LEAMAVLFVVVVLIVVLAFFRHMRGQTGGRGQANGGTSWRRRQSSRAGSGEEGGILCRGRGRVLPPETTKDTGCWHRGGRQARVASAPPGWFRAAAVCCLWVAHTAGQRQRVQTAVEMQETLQPEQGCVPVCLSRPDEL
jgi:hypothetical protein